MLHIGISGPIAAGKSTLASELSRRAVSQGLSVQTVPFATGIRELVAIEDNSARVAIIAHKIASWGWDYMKAHLAAIMIDAIMIEYPSVPGVKNRRLLQLVGTEVGRDFIHEDFWIVRTKQLLRQYKLLDYGFSDDVRFDNEVSAVDVHIRIITPDDRVHCYKQRVNTLDQAYTFSNHASEHSITLPALYTIPVCFTDEEVDLLFVRLERIRRLR